MGPGVLGDLLSSLRKIPDEKLLLGFDTSDDASVYEFAPGLCIIQTADFFPPVADDPYDFGRIAAANALSDVYAMGGRPVTALNLLCFPSCLPIEVAKEILRGGNDVAYSCGCNIAGGHSIDDNEPKYGLSVNGICKTEDLLLNSGAEAGDVLVMTKKLGAGIVAMAVKAELASDEEKTEVTEQMAAVNNLLAVSNCDAKINAATDITGFGLIGHLSEMAKASNVACEIDGKSIPLLDGAREYASMGIIPAGAYRNRAYVGDVFKNQTDDIELEDICFDPQTSGGLLFSLAEDEAKKILQAAEEHGVTAAIIGKVKKLTENEPQIILN